MLHNTNMTWYIPWTWGTKKISTSALTAEDQHAIQTLRVLLEGERDAVEDLLARLTTMESAPDTSTAQTMVPDFLRRLQNFETQAGITRALSQNSSVVKGTVLAPLLGSMRRK